LTKRFLPNIIGKLMLKGKEITRKALIDQLSKGFCKIQFRKATNGRFRSVFGTLNMKNVPAKHMQGVEKTISGGDDPNLLPVFDMVAGDWKSFYISNVLYVTTEDELRGKKKKKE
jgi:hypothetical protein